MNAHLLHIFNLFTFTLPCIVIDFFLNNQPGALIIRTYSVIISASGWLFKKKILTKSVHEGEWSVSFISRPLYSRWKSPWHPLTRGLVWTLEKCKISAPCWEHNPIIPQLSRMPNNIPRSSLFLRQLFWEPATGSRIAASRTHSPAICSHNTHQQPLRALCQFCSLTDAYRDILLSHHRCHWIFCGWVDACYMRHIGKIENKIADCRNATVSDGFLQF